MLRMLLAASPPISQGSEVPIEAVWAGVAVVVVAALIAALAGHLRARLLAKEERERLKVQLDAERERLEAQLKAEAERQREQLAHERLMADLEEIRVRLDEVIDMNEAALSAACEARLAFKQGDEQAANDQLVHAHECLGQSGYKERRLRLRIGFNHPVVEALVAYRLKVHALYDLARSSFGQGNSISANDWNTGIGQVAAAQLEVIQVGEGHVGARIT